MRTTRTALAVVAVLAATALTTLSFSTTAAATGKTCKSVTHHNVNNVKIRNAADTADTTAKVRLDDNRGVRVEMPDADAKAYAYFDSDLKHGGDPDADATVPLALVTALSYDTAKYDTSEGSKVVLPAYQLAIDPDGPDVAGGFTTLVYEPYLNGDVATGWTTHDKIAVTGKWWSTRSINGMADRSVLKTLPEINAANPNAMVWLYGVDVGAGAAGADVAWDAVTFAAAGKCATQTWDKGKPEGTPKPTTKPTVAPTAAPGNAGGTGAGRGLPVTGAALPTILSVGGVLIAAGAVLLLVLHRRRTQIDFTA